MKVVQLHRAVHRIETPFGESGTVFVYLLKGDSVALVDTGVADSPREVLQSALAQIGMALSDVDLILNTHAHLDHSGGNLAIKRLSNVSIHVHSADLPMANDLEAQVEFMTAPLRALDFPLKSVQDRASYVREFAGEPAGADVVLSDGDTVDLGAGVKLRVVHNPGHTPGSVSYFWEGEGLLMAGDAAQGQGARSGGYPLYFDAANYRRSLALLDGIDFRTLCLGHAYIGGTLVNDPTRDRAGGKAFLKESMRVADALHSAVSEAVRQSPGGAKREIALAALGELVYQVPQLRSRETDMPASGGPTLAGHIAAALAGSYPL